VVVSESALLRSALVPVYRALELDWDPETAASVEDEVPGIGLGAVEEAILAELGREFDLVEAELDPQTLALATERERRHLA
jgi:hypothetical protein